VNLEGAAQGWAVEFYECMPTTPEKAEGVTRCKIVEIRAANIQETHKAPNGASLS
jgi:hypothetical protein